MILGNAPDHRKPKAGAAAETADIEAMAVAAENGVQLIRPDAAAIVADGENDLLSAGHKAEAYPGEPTGVDQAVGQQVQYQQLQQGGIRADDTVAFDVQTKVDIGAEHGHGAQQLLKKLRQVKPGQGDRQLSCHDAPDGGHV